MYRTRMISLAFRHRASYHLTVRMRSADSTWTVHMPNEPTESINDSFDFSNDDREHKLRAMAV